MISQFILLLLEFDILLVIRLPSGRVALHETSIALVKLVSRIRAKTDRTKTNVTLKDFLLFLLFIFLIWY